MLLAEQMTAALERARTLTQLDAISTDIWRGHGAGLLGDSEAQGLAEALEPRRKSMRREITPVGIPPGRNTLFPPRRIQRSPDRARSRERRRGLAADRPLPPGLASKFTEGQRAILHIVGDEVRVRGCCSLCIETIAAWAGTCRRHVQSTIREAARLGLLVIQERRREGRSLFLSFLFCFSLDESFCTHDEAGAMRAIRG